MYSLFHKTLPRSILQMHWISVRFCEMGDMYKCLNSMQLLSHAVCSREKAAYIVFGFSTATNFMVRQVKEIFSWEKTMSYYFVHSHEIILHSIQRLWHENAYQIINCKDFPPPPLGPQGI